MKKNYSLKKLLKLLFFFPFIIYSQIETPQINSYKGSFSINLREKNISSENAMKNINSWFQLPDDYTFQEISTKTDELNITHKNYQQFYQGIKIDDAILMIHSKDGKVSMINGQIFNLKNFETSSSISPNHALSLGKKYVEVTELIQEYPIEKVIAKIPTNDSYKHHLIYKVRIDSRTPFELCNLYIDANSGEVLNKINLYANEDIEGTANTKYEGEKTITFSENEEGVYVLKEEARNIETYNATNAVFTSGGYSGAENYTSTSTTWNLTGSEQAGLDVHWGMEMTYDFYLDIFNRNSFDNQGSKIRQYINPPELQGNPNNAAALNPPYNLMIYGLGDGVNYDHFTKLDVEGHEFSHLVVGNNGNGGLNYQGEPGALNESFADIFGICIEFFANGESNWLIGDGVFLNGSHMRSFINPNSKSHPDTYNGNYWINPDDSFDNGGVHFNSSVQNYWFYLLVNGGIGTNDNDDDYDVKNIGLADARSIAYRTLMNYLTPNAIFYEAFQGSLQATIDLFGENSQQYESVVEAWFAVGIYEGMEIPCTGLKTFTEPTGTFSDGSGNSNYRDNSECTWLIAPENATQTQLTFSLMDLELDYDYVYVYDGGSENAVLMGTYTGNDLPETITSSVGDGKLFVKFVSDQYVNEAGWEATYSVLSLDVEKVDYAKYLKVYPNPSEGIITIKSQLNQKTELNIRDMLGRTVSSKNTISTGKNTIDLSNLDSGIYNLEFKTASGNHTQKLVIE
ncbi:M4 family metallopeptidase [Aureivirga marina]|uniref:M4 family metallopeptidase n=1 Tax=Aureivirga marina TaxID=1182451 RepID=UPI0018C96EDA|nr:M4 family metallopeptidase [Aureivirga marina]